MTSHGTAAGAPLRNSRPAPVLPPRPPASSTTPLASTETLSSATAPRTSNVTSAKAMSSSCPCTSTREEACGAIVAAADKLSDAMMSAATMLKERRQRSVEASRRSRADSRASARSSSPLCVAGRVTAASSGGLTTSTASSVARSRSLAPPAPPRLRFQAKPVASTNDQKELCSVWAKSFAVGTLNSQGCSKVRCFEDRIEYTVRGNSREDTVFMNMEFVHFIEPALHRPTRTLRFRLQKELQHFARHYKSDMQSHALSVTFAGVADLETFERLVLPHIERTSGSMLS
eukprot:TRINITY_DN63775_c0_g1_i1.p1 TRINITY_DN63775_c0_g1~~TRINITY_DN63775_c0_g1_i1.p1  ORF type:complete len:288 (+),score=37.79 TRINITY_DN63775_c0_g1_i1:229-1092(+)